jgi:hypothetical protein
MRTLALTYTDLPSPTIPLLYNENDEKKIMVPPTMPKKSKQHSYPTTSPEPQAHKTAKKTSPFTQGNTGASRRGSRTLSYIVTVKAHHLTLPFRRSPHAQRTRQGPMIRLAPSFAGTGLVGFGAWCSARRSGRTIVIRT